MERTISDVVRNDFKVPLTGVGASAKETVSSSSDFAALVRRHADRAYALAFHLVGNEPEAWDLVQEAFTHAFKNFKWFDTRRPFEPWFNRILKNIFLDGVRRYERKHTSSLDEPLGPGNGFSWEQRIAEKSAGPSEALDKKDAQACVRKALNSLPLLYKTPLVLCDIEKHSYERIAEILDCPVGTVRSRIHQGRTLLRKAFEKLQWGMEQELTAC